MKKVYDSLHGFIRLDETEARLIQTPAFRRLHYISQLGLAFLVYPGAQHKRYEHSLGVMHIATLMFDRVIPEIENREYWRRVVRLAALCHDLGHLPFSHMAERALIGEKGHEVWTEKIVREMEWESEALRDDVLKVALGDGSIFSELITGDFFGADRIDYLLRDAKCTGVAYGLFDYQQLIEMLCIAEGQLAIEENGIESCEALLLARHFMYKRIYQYDSVKAYAYHLSQFMQATYPDLLTSVARYLQLTDNEVMADIFAASRDSSHPGHIHASAIVSEEKRWRAYAIEKEVDLGDIPHALEKRGGGERVGLDVLVVRRDGKVVSGREVSEVEIPHPKKSWVYVEPSYAGKVRELIHA